MKQLTLFDFSIPMDLERLTITIDLVEPIIKNSKRCYMAGDNSLFTIAVDDYIFWFTDYTEFAARRYRNEKDIKLAKIYNRKTGQACISFKDSREAAQIILSIIKE